MACHSGSLRSLNASSYSDCVHSSIHRDDWEKNENGNAWNYYKYGWKQQE